LIVFPNCKLNLGLHILRKRGDGFHDLETVFYPLPLQDALEVILSPSASGSIEFTSSGLPVKGAEADNICVKAYHLVRKDFPRLPGIKMHLHKHIPMGAGLGGGSADGAFTLALLNKKLSLGISKESLADYALQLGSDCPFFIKNTPCYASGRGEVLEEISLDLTAYKFVMVNPGIHINTGWAFSQVTPLGHRSDLKEIIQLPVQEWKNCLVNDFEEAVSIQHPEIKSCKEKLYECGALYAAMTGSGSTVYGVFLKDAEVQPNFPPHYFVKII
jgi:4-diphosphocytidyl-2-C-methyl-D-erythritol kinase